MRFMIRSTWCVVAFAVLAPPCGASEPGFILAHKTLHVGPDMNGAHRFELKGGIQGTQGKGTIVIDKNCCDLNEFGDRTKCTLLACEPIDVEFTRLRLKDPAGQGREVYAIEGKDLPKSFNATLVIGRKCKPFVLRLVVEVGGTQSAFPLVPEEEYDVAPGPIGVGRGRAFGGEEAERFTQDRDYMASLPSVGEELDGEERTDGFLFWNNRGTNWPGGIGLKVRGTKISVYVRDVQWYYSTSFDSKTTSPNGQGGQGGSGWTYPRAHKYGIVLRQGDSYWNISSTDPNRPTVISGLTNTVGVKVTINDTNGYYGDNWGSFDIFIRKDD